MKENIIQGYLTPQQKKELILEGKDVPTMIFSKDLGRSYIVKTRGTIFGNRKKSKKIYLKNLK